MQIFVENKQQVRPQLGTSGALERASVLFSSLANAVRIGVFLRLIDREWSVNELAKDLKISQSALSQHLSKLRKAKLVTVRKDAQTSYYRCTNRCVVRLLAQLELVESVD